MAHHRHNAQILENQKCSCIMYTPSNIKRLSEIEKFFPKFQSG